MKSPFLRYKHIPTTQKLNKIKIPVTLLKPNIENANNFNNMLKYCRDNNYNELKMTPSGGISTKGLTIFPAYYYSFGKIGAELIVCNTQCYRIQFRSEPVKDHNGKVYSGTKAWHNFLGLCERFKIDMTKYLDEDGKEIADNIPKPPIELGIDGEFDKRYLHVHHIDFHSSYPAGLANTHPEFKELLDYLYSLRKKNELAKATLNYSIGMMHSKNIGWKYSTLANDAICDNNDRVRMLAKIIRNPNRKILLFNTDGFWYQGEIYHGVGEGKEMGEWENDHIDCTFRIKSVGAYEYIEDEQYVPVIRGVTDLELGKPKEEWEWGDIYQSSVYKFRASKDGISYEK